MQHSAPMPGVARRPRVGQNLVKTREHGAVAAALLRARVRGQRDLQRERHWRAHLRPHPPLAQRLQHRPDVLRLSRVQRDNVWAGLGRGEEKPLLKGC